MKIKRKAAVIFQAITAVICLLFFLQSAGGAEINYPVPCYQGEELKKVRDWEKIWAGKKITLANIDQVKEFLPENFYNMITDTKTWNETWFEIVPYKEYRPTDNDIKFTREGKSTIDSDGKIKNYVSGIPFPAQESHPLKSKRMAFYIAHNWI